MFENSPTLIAQHPVVLNMIDSYHHYIPLASLELGWGFPTLFAYFFSFCFFEEHKFYIAVYVKIKNDKSPYNSKVSLNLQKTFLLKSR